MNKRRVMEKERATENKRSDLVLVLNKDVKKLFNSLICLFYILYRHLFHVNMQTFSISLCLSLPFGI